MKRFWKSSTRTSTNNNSTGQLLAAGFFLLLLLFFGSIALGPSSLKFGAAWKYLLTGHGSALTGRILLYARLPRSLGAIACGAALATAGLLLQCALNNALASAGTIGVNAGSGLFVVIAALLFPGAFLMKSLFAFAGALLAALLVFFIARKTAGARSKVIMAGVAVASFLGALSDALITLFPDSVMDRNAFFIGGFAQLQMKSVLSVLPLILGGLVLAILAGSRMNILALGDEVAASLGLGVKRQRFFLLFAAALLAAAAVSVAGLLGFVGLVVPHIMRRLVGADYRRLVLLTPLFGADLVLLCDILARLLLRPYEIPVGILLSCLGAPYFLFLILKKPGRVSL